MKISKQQYDNLPDHLKTHFKKIRGGYNAHPT